MPRRSRRARLPRFHPIDIEIVALAGLVIVAAAFAAAALVYARRNVAQAPTSHDADSEQRLDQARATEQEAKSVLLAAKEEAARRRDEAEAEVRERRAEVARLEQRTNQREEGLDRRLRELHSNEQRRTRRETELETLRQTIEDERATIARELERVAALSEPEARAEVVRSVGGELGPEIAERIRQAEAQVREEAAAQSREILIAAMQRQASEQSGEASVTVVHLPSDELKGRIIGREGRNIRALEAATGVDVIVDDTPEAIVLSSFDPGRRGEGRQGAQRARPADQARGRAGLPGHRADQRPPRARPAARHSSLPQLVRPQRARPQPGHRGPGRDDRRRDRL